MKKFPFIYPILLIFLLIAIYYLSALYKKNPIDGKLIRIEKGKTAAQIADILHTKGIIKNRNIFYYYVVLSKQSKNLDFGTYLFDGDLSIIDVLDKIKEGDVRLRKVTIPEGLSIKKVCKILSRRKFGNFDNLMHLAFDSQFAKEMTGFEINNLEGFLYPETYLLPDGVDERYIMRHLVRSFFDQTGELDFQPNELLDFYETIILASIVEREARFSDEMPLIASVYLNRIKLGYKLQADPTVAFALEQENISRKKIYYKDLNIDSPFNTYLHYGLPPTPICSPSINAISAVIKAEDSNFLFFFADGSGRHEFSRNYQEHLRKLTEMRNNGK